MVQPSLVFFQQLHGKILHIFVPLHICIILLVHVSFSQLKVSPKWVSIQQPAHLQILRMWIGLDHPGRLKAQEAARSTV